MGESPSEATEMQSFHGATLSGGRYRFHPTNPVSSRTVIQVLSSDGRIVYGMFNTIWDRRRFVTDDPAVTFRETPAGRLLPSLFYGGYHEGYQFVYPEDQR